jgi:outer membrane receptor for ferrienterochelin and colicins
LRAYLFIAVWIGLCLLSEGLRAQSITVSDPAGKGLSYAFVAAEGADGQLITKGYCDQNGRFEIQPSISSHQKQMRLIISYLGYVGIDTTISPHNNRSLQFKLQPDQNYLQEAVITDQYQSRDFSGVVQKVEVIDAAKMEDMAAINLSDVLSNEMNIRLGRDQTLGTTGMQMMGIGGQNVKILIDGVPVIGRLADQLDLSQLNINNIERIEIVQGPMSVSYGTNALAGAINIITKKKTKEAKELRLNAQMESMNQFNTFGHLSWRSKQHQHMLTGGRNFFGGWSPNRIDRTWDWLPKEQYYLRYQYLRKIRNTDFQWRTDGMRELILNRGVPRAPYGEEAFDLTYTTWRIDNAVTINSKWKNNRYFNLIAANNQFYRVKNRYLKDLVTLNETLTSGKGDQDTTAFNASTLRATYSKESGERLNYQMGVDANYEIGRGERIENGGSSMIDAAVFTSMEWKPHRLITLRPGLRYGYNSLYNLPLIASLQTRYMNKSGYILRLSVGNGFRAPGLKELYLDFIDATHDVYGNPDLKAERSINYMLSAEKDYALKHGRIKPSVNVFYNRIQDKIELVDLTTSSSRKATATYFNISDFRSHGLNARLQGKFKGLEGSLQYGLTGIRTNITNLEEEQQFLYNSQWNSNLGLRLPYDMKISLFVNYFGQLQRFAPGEAGSITLQSSEGFSLTDVTLRKAIKQRKINVSIGVRNLFNITNIQSNLNTGGAHSGNAGGQQAVAMGRIGFIKMDWTLHGKEK